MNKEPRRGGGRGVEEGGGGGTPRGRDTCVPVSACVLSCTHNPLSPCSIYPRLFLPLAPFTLSLSLSLFPSSSLSRHSRSRQFVSGTELSFRGSSSASGAIHALLGFPSEPFKSPLLSPPRQQTTAAKTLRILGPAGTVLIRLSFPPPFYRFPSSQP